MARHAMATAVAFALWFRHWAQCPQKSCCMRYLVLAHGKGAHPPGALPSTDTMVGVSQPRVEDGVGWATPQYSFCVFHVLRAAGLNASIISVIL